MPFVAFAAVDGEHRIAITPARACILSWNASQPIDIDVRIERVDGARSAWLPYVRREPWRSCSPATPLADVTADVIEAPVAIAALDVRIAGAEFVAVATPWPEPTVSPLARVLTHVAVAIDLEVPSMSQYVGEERGWCGAASLAMVLGSWARRTGRDDLRLDVADVAARIYDADYGGTGNWTFAAAYASALGMRAVVAYLRDLEHAQRLVAAGVPLILPIAWNEGDLPGAPLSRSPGHLLVLRGFDARGDVLVNDPAVAGVATTYSRAAFEQAWTGAGRVAIVVAPRDAAPLGILTS